MRHQLIQSPIFGLETLDSPQVASLRRELRSLKGVAEEAPADGGRTVASESAASPRPATQAARSKGMKQIETELASVPTWSEVPEYLQSTSNLLRQISEELSAGSGSARGSKREIRRSGSAAASFIANVCRFPVRCGNRGGPGSGKVAAQGRIFLRIRSSGGR
jgi:hypothetical protein